MRQNATQTKAMTEVALALSMGFFSIMVLAMVSMGSVSSKHSIAKQTAATVSIEPSAKNPAPDKNVKPGHVTVSNQNLIIWFKNNFFDHKLNKVDGPTLINQIDEPVLAVSPTLNLKDLISIQSKVSNRRLRVTNLNDAWLSRLEKLKKIRQ